LPAELSAMVQLMAVRAPAEIQMPPPLPAELPATVLLMSVAVPPPL